MENGTPPPLYCVNAFLGEWRIFLTISSVYASNPLIYFL